MTRKMAKSAERTSFGTPGTMETPENTAQPACGLRGAPPSAIVYAVPQFIWGMSAKRLFQLRLLKESLP